jgi:4-amino-4-deoxy-L-arabinose transferase-like glycosyltransferase
VESPLDSPARPSAALSWIGRHSLALALALVVFASIRIVATYAVFNHTSDEPNHIACGMEWLDKGTYTYETQHPPLARVAAALGPFLLGIRSQSKTVAHDTLQVPEEGLEILYKDHHYERTLTAARLGILPFFWIACLAVYWWARRDFGGSVAVAAVFLFSFMPNVLAHAGLATTDMALTAFVAATFVCALAWVEKPTPARAILFGASFALAILSKFSAPIFLAAAWSCAFLWYLARQGFQWAPPAAGARRLLPTLGYALSATILPIWAGYRFSLGQPGMPWLPFPELFSGFQAVLRHNAQGHFTYLLGQRNTAGFWYFYPVVLAVKTPLAFLALAAIALPLAFRRGSGSRAWIPLSFSIAILAIGMGSHINIGIRHILPIYCGLSIVAALALVRFFERPHAKRWTLAALPLLLAWYAGSSLLSHPDYLPYFNELAGSEPEKIVVDSNLDWGQDMQRLAARLRQVGATGLTFNQFFLAHLEKEHGFPPIHEMDLLNPSPGWNAVSLTNWKIARLGLWSSHPDVTLWPDRVPQQERIGKSILLWYFPPAGVR